MIIACKNCGLIVEKPPEPAETLVMESHLQFLSFDDEKSMEEHSRRENCPMCGVNLLSPAPDRPSLPRRKVGWPKGKPRGPRKTNVTSNSPALEEPPSTSSCPPVDCRRKLFESPHTDEKRRRPMHRPILKKAHSVPSGSTNVNNLLSPTSNAGQDSPPRNGLVRLKELPVVDEGSMPVKSPVRTRVPTRAGRKAEEMLMFHLNHPRKIDPESMPEPLSPGKIPPCGNDFDHLGCVCAGWKLTAEEMYDDHCGRADCFLGCICSYSVTIVSPKRRESFSAGVRASIASRDHGEDLREEYLAASSMLGLSSDGKGGSSPRRVTNEKLESPLKPSTKKLKQKTTNGVHTAIQMLMVKKFLKKQKLLNGIKSEDIASIARLKKDIARTTLGNLIQTFGSKTNIPQKAMPRLVEFQNDILVDYVVGGYQRKEQASTSKSCHSDENHRGGLAWKTVAGGYPVHRKRQEVVVPKEESSQSTAKTGISCDIKVPPDRAVS